MNLSAKKWWRSFYTFLLLSAGAPTFLTANDLTTSLPLIATIGIFCLIIRLVSSKIIRVILAFFAILVSLFVYFPPATVRNNWFFELTSQIQSEFNELVTNQFHYFPELPAFILMLCLVYLLATLTIDYDLWALPFLALVLYFMMLSIFREFDLLTECIFIVIILFSYLFIRQLSLLPKKSNRWLFVFFATVILLGSLSISAWIPTRLPEVTQIIEAKSAPVREFFNKQGLYARIRTFQEAGRSRTGFSENDETLGGPIYDQTDIVFTAVQESGHYYKIQNKGVYTGTGWTENSRDSFKINELPHQLLNYPETIVAEPTTLQLTTEEQTFLPYSYGNSSLTAFPLMQDSALFFLPDTQRFVLDKSSSFTATFTIANLSYTYEMLVDSVLTGADQAEHQTELQLPENLPKRITSLAEEITTTKTTLLDQVLAIQDYLKSSGEFRYSKVDTPHTPANRDYVDHFLFDSKVGYCDNFSSAMVVLLRTLGIPARWTKGFTMGYQTGSHSNGLKEYSILNSNAHSWPEVYFPGFGWLPFEPTPAFANPATAQSEQETTPTAVPESQSQSSAAETTAVSSTTGSEAITSTEDNPIFSDTTIADRSLWKFVVFFLFIFLLVPLLIPSFRQKVRWHIFYYQVAFFASDSQRTYQQLLAHVEKLFPRQRAESLQDYSYRVEKAISMHQHLIKLTKNYEETIYGQNQAMHFDKETYLTIIKTISKSLHFFSKRN